ncbi:hypothetical protein CF319_g8951 [Tilletia indica]|nr:hypothetical protein CF319_g8951 [Tilletia indica]
MLYTSAGSIVLDDGPDLPRPPHPGPALEADDDPDAGGSDGVPPVAGEDDVDNVEVGVPVAVVVEDVLAAASSIVGAGEVSDAFLDDREGLTDRRILSDLTRSLRKSLAEDPENTFLPLIEDTLLDEAELRSLSPPPEISLSKDDLATLDLYSAWVTSGAAECVYNRMAAVFGKHERDVKTLHLARRMVEQYSEVQVREYDMCSSSCMAFNGPYAELLHCNVCSAPRYQADGKTPLKSYQYTPILPRLQAYYSSTHWATRLLYRSEQLERAKTAFKGAQPDPHHRFGDITDGFVHTEGERASIFQDHRDCVVMISTDGAQVLDNRRPSSAWVVLLQLVNLPPTFRFKPDHQHVSLIVPGPSNPVNLESFLWPLCAEIAQLGEQGAPTWDARTSEWFRLRVHLGGVLADQPGSAKLSRLTGHSGLHGCRVCMMRAVRQGVSYFPLRAMLCHKPANHGRSNYDAQDLPTRSLPAYAEAVGRLANASATNRVTVQRDTGVVTLPLVAFSPMFNIPDFFPLDPFHLFNMNVPSLIWKTFNSPLTGEFGFDDAQRVEFGEFIADNARHYPSYFSSRAPRDIARYGNSNYRMVEWGSVFHHFLPAYLHHISAPLEVRTMVDDYLTASDLAMHRQGLNMEQINLVRNLFIGFVETWERLYVYANSSVDRATLSVHHLLHVSEQIFMLGSIRATSQATCERYMGILKKGLSAFRFPYASMALRSIHRTQATLATLRFGTDSDFGDDQHQDDKLPTLSIRLTSGHQPLPSRQLEHFKRLIARYVPYATDYVPYGRLVDGSLDVRAIRAMYGDLRCTAVVKVRTRVASLVIAVVHSHTCVFSFYQYLDRQGVHQVGRVIQFAAVYIGERVDAYAFVQMFSTAEQSRTFMAGRWVDQWSLVPCAALVEMVAALLLQERVYVVRRSSWQAAELRDIIDEDGIDGDE